MEQRGGAVLFLMVDLPDCRDIGAARLVWHPTPEHGSLPPFVLNCCLFLPDLKNLAWSKIVVHCLVRIVAVFDT